MSRDDPADATLHAYLSLASAFVFMVAFSGPWRSGISVRARHIGWQPGLEPREKAGHHQRTFAGNSEYIAAGRPEANESDPRLAGAGQNGLGMFRRHNKTRLIFTEPKGVRGGGSRRFEHRADVRSHRHLGKRHQNAAVGNIVDRRRQTLTDQRANEVGVAAFRGQIDRRRRALLPPADLAQIKRLAEPALRRTDEQDRLALSLECKRHGFGEIVQKT